VTIGKLICKHTSSVPSQCHAYTTCISCTAQQTTGLACSHTTSLARLAILTHQAVLLLQACLRADPACAMCYWGLAYAQVIKAVSINGTSVSVHRTQMATGCDFSDHGQGSCGGLRGTQAPVPLPTAWGQAGSRRTQPWKQTV